MTVQLFITLLLAMGALTPATKTKTYSVKEIPDEISITGKGDNALWKKANELTDFTYPWEKEPAPATHFKALHSKEWLYCLFDVFDDHITIHVDKNDKSEVGSSCRAEIFFRIDEKLSPYYGLEIDPLARVMDYKVEYYRKFDSKWSWPAGDLIVKSHRRPNGYTIELAVSKKSLRELGLLKEKTLQAGLYRGDCIMKNDTCNFKWISWVKPDSKTPDFHIPSSFGELQLE
jgi:hypothetical protein